MNEQAVRRFAAFAAGAQVESVVMVDGVHVLMGEARTNAVEDDRRRRREAEERRHAEQRERRDGDGSDSRGRRRARSRDTIDEPRMVDGGDESEDEFGGAGGGGGGLGDRTGVG